MGEKKKNFRFRRKSLYIMCLYLYVSAEVSLATYIMRQRKAKSVAASNDDELADFINNIESKPDCTVKEVIFIGNDSADARVYQILYVEG